MSLDGARAGIVAVVLLSVVCGLDVFDARSVATGDGCATPSLAIEQPSKSEPGVRDQPGLRVDTPLLVRPCATVALIHSEAAPRRLASGTRSASPRSPPLA